MRQGDLSFRKNLPLRTKERGGEDRRERERDGGEEEKEVRGENKKMFRESVPGAGSGEDTAPSKGHSLQGQAYHWLLCFCLVLRSRALRSFLHLR